MAIHTIGLDIAKNSFSAHGFDVEGITVLSKDLKRGQVLSFFAKLPATRVGLEACASAHYWARELVKFGYDLKLIPAQRVKAFQGVTGGWWRRGGAEAANCGECVSGAAGGGEWSLNQGFGERRKMIWLYLLPRRRARKGPPHLGGVCRV